MARPKNSNWPASKYSVASNRQSTEMLKLRMVTAKAM